jgi:hypothetical protein
MAIEATDGGTTRSSGLSGGEKRTIKDVVKQGINSGKMKLVKQEVPFGGPGKAVANFVERTGARIIVDRKGAQIVAEKAAAENKVSKVAARRVAEEAAGPKARRLGGETSLKGTAPKPDVRITTKSGKYRGYGTLSKEATTVTKPVSRTLNTRSAVTVTRTAPKKASDVVANRLKAQRDRIRESLTIKVNPARPKITPKRAAEGGASKTNAREDEIVNRYYRIKNRDSGAPETRGGQSQDSIDKRLAKGAEKEPRSSKPSDKDYEADARVNEALNPKSRLKAKVKPGVPTKTTKILRTVGGKPGSKTAALKGAIRNQRKVLRQREITEAAKRAEKAGQ